MPGEEKYIMPLLILSNCFYRAIKHRKEGRREEGRETERGRETGREREKMIVQNLPPNLSIKKMLISNTLLLSLALLSAPHFSNQKATSTMINILMAHNLLDS